MGAGREGQGTGRGEWGGLGLRKLKNEPPRGTEGRATLAPPLILAAAPAVTCHRTQTAFFQARSKGSLQTETLARTLGLLFFLTGPLHLLFFLFFLLRATFNL